LYWLLVAALAAGAAGYVASRAAALDRARHRLGSTRPVVVTARAVAAGEKLTAADVRIVAMPIAWAPPDAFAVLPPGATAPGPIDRGEVVTPARVGAAGRSALASMVATDRRAVAVGRGDHPLPLVVGDHVDVVSVLAVAEGADALVVARDVPVVAVGEATVVVAVAVDEEAAVAGAAVSGAVTLALAA
jgi:Flp pilus assembly protein CpaB